MVNKSIVQIGVVGVDSGQLMITDPCYIDGEWKNEDFEDIRIYQNNKNGDKLVYPKDFSHYSMIIDKYGVDMISLLDSGDRDELPKPASKFNFSYNACCLKTLESNYGELKFNEGNKGVGVVFSASGDGQFPVFAEIIEIESGDGSSNKFLKKVWIELISDEDISSY